MGRRKRTWEQLELETDEPGGLEDQMQRAGREVCQAEPWEVPQYMTGAFYRDTGGSGAPPW